VGDVPALATWEGIITDFNAISVPENVPNPKYDGSRIASAIAVDADQRFGDKDESDDS
jgi:hypothetical protein